MRKEVFLKKAESMEDFVIFYQKANDTKYIQHATVSFNLDVPYIQERLRGTFESEDKVLLWNWSADRRLIVDYSRIKKLVPLASILKNHR